MLSCFAVVEKTPHAKERAARLVSHIVSRHPDYKLCFSGTGMTVLTAGEDPSGLLKLYKLAGAQGVVIGRLFRRSCHSVAELVPELLSEQESRDIVCTNGRHLVDKYWGRYAAFCPDRTGQRNIVLSDPSGALSIYYFETDAYVLFFSNGADFHDLGLTRLSFNVDRIVSHVAMHLFDYDNSGFNEIKKVRRGGVLSVGENDARTEQYWHPGKFVSKSKHLSVDGAADLLSNVIVQCVDAWGGVFGRVGISLSGGLDSSIVLAALKNGINTPHVFASHGYFPSSAESDERRWACEMAEYVGVDIQCTELRLANIDPTTIAEFEFEVEPVNCLGNVISGQRNEAFLEKNGCAALLTGHGGDMIFMQGAMASAEDYVWNHGWSWGVLRSVVHNALITRNSFYGALRDTVRLWLSDEGLDLGTLLSGRKNPIVNEDLTAVLDINQQCAHWLGGFQQMSLAKAAQLASSWCVQHHQVPGRAGSAVLQLHPLLSQPVLEVVAQIPAHLFCCNGIDRGLARYAFRRHLPRSIAARQSKGSANDYYEDLYSRYLAFYRDSLCEGVLMEMDILNARAAERAFAIDVSENSMAKYHVLELIDIEYWARWWKRKSAGQSNVVPI